MAKIGAQLEGPLRKIAALAAKSVKEPQVGNDPDLDLFEFRSQIGYKSKEDICAFVAKEMERLTGGKKSVRLCKPELSGIRAQSMVTMVVTSADAPQEEVAVMRGDMFGFAVCAAEPGYATF